MATVRRTSVVGASRAAVAAFHDDPANLTRITPPNVRVEVLEAPARTGAGATVRLRIGKGPIMMPWESHIVEHTPGRGFTDVQRRGPFLRFHHRHLFEDAEGGTRITDVIDYDLPFGPLGALADRIVVARELRKMLEYRHRRTAELLDR
jgi:ligand-binding SRPBCC domain-containing protein